MREGAQVMPRGLAILMTVLLMGGVQDLVAQRGGRGSRADMELRIQARFDNLVREDLGLGEDQWRRLQGAVGDFRTRRLEFLQSERNTRARVGRLGGPAGGQQLTEVEASAILAEMLELGDEEATLLREEQEALLRILSPQQVVRYLVMRQQLGDSVLRLRGRGGPGRGGRGPQSGRRSGQPRPDGGGVIPDPGVDGNGGVPLV